MEGGKLDANVFSRWGEVSEISVAVQVREAYPEESICFREANTADRRGRKNDLERAVKKEIASFLNNEKFYITKYSTQNTKEKNKIYLQNT